MPSAEASASASASATADGVTGTASASASASAFGGATSTVGAGAAAITADRRAKINLSLGSFIEKELGKVVASAVGASIDIQQIAVLAASLKTGLRASIGSSLGIGGGISAGGVGGSAGGGLSLKAGFGASATMTGGASGRIGGVASGGLSLGAGLGTRAFATAGGGAQVALGASASGNFGVGAQAGFSGRASASASATGSASGGVKVGAGASVKASAFAAIDGAMVGAGLSGSEQSALRFELRKSVSKSIDDSFKSAFGPDPGYPHAAGRALLACKVTMQRLGNWTAECEIDRPDDDSPVPTGPFTFDIDGVEFRGSVVPDRAGGWGGRQRIKVTGGAGGLDTTIQARNYSGGLTRASTVIGDILRDSGESLSIEAHKTFLDVRLPAWQRSEGTAKHALEMLCAKIGCQWRVLRDGTVWVGTDEWPEVEPAGTVMHQDWSTGVVHVAPDNTTLVPGIIVRGQKIEQVIHRFGDDGKLRCDLHAHSHRELADKLLERTSRKTEFGYRYRCAVSRQNADGTVDVVTDDARMKGRGVAKCRIRAGLPGVTVKVPAGARCLVGWDDGDPALPYVSDWESGTAFTSIDIG